MIHPEDWTFYTPTSDNPWGIVLEIALFLLAIGLFYAAAPT